MLKVNVHKNFGEFQLNMDFTEASRRIGILGASGSGKSMTLKSIAGILQPDQGEIVLNDHVLYDSARRINLRPQERRVGYLFQNYALFPTMTVAENVAAGLHGSRAEKEARVAEMLSKFQIGELGGRLPGQLSGGQQQRVALARIMAYQPDVILLDEPFSALDVYLKDHMQEELIGMLADYEGIVIMVSHSRDEIYRFSERLLIVDQGRIVSHGDTREIFANPRSRQAAMLTGCKNLSKAERRDSHHLYAAEWGIELTLDQEIPENVKHVGLRAHQFLPIWGERQQNCIRFDLSSFAELQFERNYYVKPETENPARGDFLTWFVQREDWPQLDEKGYPDYLQFPEKDIMLLY